ncbi:hypothetical protein CTA2_11265, partial [Colletotrichum tanaceti]
DGDGAHYSASLDLCAIFESILNDVYAKRIVSAEALERISERHRRWAARFGGDGMRPSRYVDAADGERYPNMGLYYLKEAYYWSIMLLSRPFLIDFVSRNIARSQASSTWGGDDTHTHTHAHTPQSSQTSPPSSQLLVHACVDSAIRTVDLLSSLASDKNVAKRHPFVINAAFVSALVLGLAVLGDLDATFPLDRGLGDARALLRELGGGHDPVASRELSIVENLQGACVLYRERRARRMMELQGALVGELFGSLHDVAPAAAVVAATATEMYRTGPGLDHLVAGGPGGPGLGPALGLGLGLVDHRHGGDSEAGEVSSMDQSVVSLTTGSTDGPSTDMFVPVMSPRTLLFGSYGQDVPFLPTVDASTAHLGYADGMMLSDAGALLEPAC